MSAGDFLTGIAQSPQSKASGPMFLNQTETSAVRISITEPEGVDYGRNGSRFYLGNNAAVTGIGPIQALATTTAQWTLFNPSTSGKAYVFDTFGLWLVSGTAGTTGNVGSYTIFSLPAQTGLASGCAIASCDGSANTSSLACKSNITITTPAAPVWIPFSDNESLGSAVDSLVLVASELRGRIIIPPGQGLGLNAAGAAGSSPLFAPFARWYELSMNTL